MSTHARNRRPQPPQTSGVAKLTQRAILRWRIPGIVDATPEELVYDLWASPRAADTDTDADKAVAEFSRIDAELNAAKQGLDAIPPKEFEALSRGLDLYRGLKWVFQNEYGFPAGTTNATLKMYELLMQEGLLVCGPAGEGREPGAPGAAARVRMFGNAELPGAFLVAVNHFVRTRCPGSNFDWVASSYYPEEAAKRGDLTILGDAYGIYAANRRHWLMGPRPNAMPEGVPPVDGDLTNATTVATLADAVHARFGGDPSVASGASLYTSDAGVDVSADYGRQEEATALLNFGQILCGILSLAPGGNLVTKQYTFFTPLSRSLICLVAAVFDTVDIVKPLTSRPLNSEIYVVAKGFRGVDRDLANRLLGRLAELSSAAPPLRSARSIVDPAIMPPVEEALLRVARQLFGRQQVAFLKEAQVLYAKFRGQLGDLEATLRRDAKQVQSAWLSANNPVSRIRAEFLLPAAAPQKGPRGGGAGEDRPEDETASE